MTGDDTTEEREGVLSRREMLGATTVLGGAALLPSGTAGASTSGSTEASADMQTSTEPRIKLGDDYAIDDSPNGNGDLVIEHLPSGATFSYDSSAGSWTMGSFSTDDATINTSLDYAGHTVGAILEAESGGLREEHGTASHADPGNATDGTWETNTADITTVSFGTAFSSAPITAAFGNTVGKGAFVAKNASTTGFDHQWICYVSSGSQGPTGRWLAIGSE